MQLIDGKKISLQLQEDIANEVKQLLASGLKQPHLAAILVGNDGGSETYVASKIKACERVGFKSTLIWEDKYEYGITDNYFSFNDTKGNGYTNLVKVRFYADKDNITFEQLEGRRYYFARLIEKIISKPPLNP